MAWRYASKGGERLATGLRATSVASRTKYELKSALGLTSCFHVFILFRTIIIVQK